MAGLNLADFGVEFVAAVVIYNYYADHLETGLIDADRYFFFLTWGLNGGKRREEEGSV